MVRQPAVQRLFKIQTWNRSRQDPKKHKEMMRVGRLNLQRSCELYRAQMADGLYFLHEYRSSSVHEPCLVTLLKEPGVFAVKGPMCFWGMTSKDEQGEGLVKKETWLVTNSPYIAAELDRECTNVNKPAPLRHRHVHLINQRAHHARVYPPKLVAAILRGCRAQLAWTGDMNNSEDPVIPREPEMSEELEWLSQSQSG